MFEIEINDLLFEKLIVFSHKKIYTLISSKVSLTFGVQINNRWRNLYSITSNVMGLDCENKYSFSVTREHELAVIRVLRDLYKKGIIERQEVELHERTIKRGFFRRSEWRLKPLE